MLLDRDQSTQATIRIVIFCGDGRFFTGLRQELLTREFLDPPMPRFAPEIEHGENYLKHGSFYLLEAVGPNYVRFHETFNLISSREIHDDLKIPTQVPLRFTNREYRYWLRSPTGPCTMHFYMHNKDRLIRMISQETTPYVGNLIRALSLEWFPYLAGMCILIILDKRKSKYSINLILGLFIQACRLQLTVSRSQATCALRRSDNVTDIIPCSEAVARGGPAGDCL